MSAQIEVRDKLVVHLRARAATAGYELHIIDAGNGTGAFLVERWGKYRELRDLDAVEAVLRQVGG